MTARHPDLLPALATAAAAALLVVGTAALPEPADDASRSGAAITAHVR